MSAITVSKLDRYNGVLRCPPDKSISVRAVLLGAVSSGATLVRNISLCDDVKSAIACVCRLGAKVRVFGNDILIKCNRIRSTARLDCGNSATTARLLTGLLSGFDGVYTIDGDKSLRRRSMVKLIDALRPMGAKIESTDGRLPIKITGARLKPIEYRMQTPSAQIKSALLLASLSVPDYVTIIEMVKTRDHTERMLSRMNGDILIDGNTVRCRKSRLSGCCYTVPGDVSSAMYPITLALCVNGGECNVFGVGLNKTRTAALEILRRIGADIRVSGIRNLNGEPCGNIRVRHSALGTINLNGDDAARVIDEIPALCALASHIDGCSAICGVGELANKESDRIATTVAALNALGCNAERQGDDITVIGGKPLAFGTVESCGDHRIAMSAAVCAAAGNGGVITNAECVAVSYPGFFGEVIGV